jgi:ABC-type sulfate transport system permease component
MIMDASPLQLTVSTIGLFLLLLLFVYIAARLAVWGGAKSWRDFWKNKQNKKED